MILQKLLTTRFYDKKGQTAVEYILLLLVMTSIITSILMTVKNKYLGNPEACESAAERKKLLCKINSYIQPTGGNKPFQYYPIKK
jgi:Flp pilus assembly pilin Flp